MKLRSSMQLNGIEGALMALSPLPLLFTLAETDAPQIWILSVALLSSTAFIICSLTLFRRPVLGKILGLFSVTGAYISAFPYIATNPFSALIGNVLLIGTVFIIIDFRIEFNETNHKKRYLQKALYGTIVSLGVIIFGLIIVTSHTYFTACVIITASIFAQIFFTHWAVKTNLKYFILLPATGLVSISIAFFYSLLNIIPFILLIISLLILLLLPVSKIDIKKYPLEIFLNHPARILFTTFLILCIIGTFFLILPLSSTRADGIDIIDAVFTSVSAVCVTGLIVLDTPIDFSFWGQFFILLLIQLGGLGIMGITTIALHATGHRLSLKHERLMSSLSDTDHKNLLQSLITILKFTFAVEGLGTILLTFLFYSSGDVFGNALWRGIFTAISGFCNAGFALQSDSLIAYQSNPLILHVVAMLIIIGGMAPATSLMLPKWITGEKILVSAQIAFTTTAVFLFMGTLLIMVFEWNGTLANLSFGNKIQNAWFQSATLRTAGFNSVDIANVASPTFLIMIFFMFVGGSPGGTAGGVKTTTIGILALTFWANISNRGNVIIQNRRIHASNIYRAVTIICAGMIIWFLAVLMLETTQTQLYAKDIIFEATSAIGTVGLSTGATQHLDEIGKVIIILAMFIGRIGPMTLFMLLNVEQTSSSNRYPDAEISLN